MQNKAILVGHLGQAPEIKRTKGGQRYAMLSLATSESWKSKEDGERKQRTEWHRIVIWNEKLVEICEKYAVKGAKLYVEGRIASRKWTDDKGIERYVTEIVLQGFQANLQFLDERASNRAPDPGDADEYGATTEMERSYA